MLYPLSYEGPCSFVQVRGYFSVRATRGRALGVPAGRVSSGFLNRVSCAHSDRVGAGQRVARSSERGEIRIGARDPWQGGREQRFRKPCVTYPRPSRPMLVSASRRTLIATMPCRRKVSTRVRQFRRVRRLGPRATGR
jgi:hypothetical protein